MWPRLGDGGVPVMAGVSQAPSGRKSVVFFPLVVVGRLPVGHRESGFKGWESLQVRGAVSGLVWS